MSNITCCLTILFTAGLPGDKGMPQPPASQPGIAYTRLPFPSCHILQFTRQPAHIELAWPTLVACKLPLGAAFVLSSCTSAATSLRTNHSCPPIRLTPEYSPRLALPDCGREWEVQESVVLLAS
jgi:hypothetical protein